MATTDLIINAVKNDQDVTYIVEINGDRHLIEVPLEILREHDEISKIRHDSPKNVDLLQDSMKQTGGTSVYTPCVYVELEGDKPVYWIADGHQRVRAAKANGDKTIVVQYVSRWQEVSDVMFDTMGLQWARYEVSDDDIISIVQTGKLTNKQIAVGTGKSDSVISRLAKLADHMWLRKMVKDRVLGYNNAAMLIDAAGNNSKKLSALKQSLTKKYDEAKENATRWSNRIKTDRRAWDSKAQAKAKVATYFKDVDWKQWKFVLETEDPVQDADGNYHLEFADAKVGGGKGVWIGDIKDWEDEIAVHGFFGSKINDLNTEDIVNILNNWDDIRLKVKAIRDRRLHAEAAKKFQIPSSNPVEAIPTPEPPEDQDVKMDIQDAPTDAVEAAQTDAAEAAPTDAVEAAQTDAAETAPTDAVEAAQTDAVDSAGSGWDVDLNTQP